MSFRDGGGTVVLITNAPRPKADVVRQLDRLWRAPRRLRRCDHVGRCCAPSAWRPSGCEALPRRAGARPADLLRTAGSSLPARTTANSSPAPASSTTRRKPRTTTTRASPTGRSAGVPMLCVNPDIVVERGDRLVWCAGALAERYRERGGETIIVGKPYAPIYETAFDPPAGDRRHGGSEIGSAGDRRRNRHRCPRRGRAGDRRAFRHRRHSRRRVRPTRMRRTSPRCMRSSPRPGLGARALMTRLVWEPP